MKRGFPVVGILLVVLVAGALALTIGRGPMPTATPTPSPHATPSPSGSVEFSTELKTFNSFDEISEFLKAAPQNHYGGYYRATAEAMPLAAGAKDSAGAPSSQPSAQGTDYSGTNVQVAGVDEADTFKTDGTYIYTITQGKIAILRAYPAGEARLLSVLNDSEYTGLYVNGGKLVAFGSERFDWRPVLKPLAEEHGELPLEAPNDGNPSSRDASPPASEKRIAPGMIAPDTYPSPIYWPDYSTFVKVFDVSNPEAPTLVKKIDFKGNYVSSRMIGAKVYAIVSDSASRVLPMPVYAVDGKVQAVGAAEVSYFDYPFDNYQFTTVVGIDLNDLQKPEFRKVVLMGYGTTIYVSPANAYISYTRYNSYYPVWEAYRQVLEPHFDAPAREKLAAIGASDASEWRKDSLRVQVATSALSSLGEKQAAELWEKIYEAEQAIRQESVRESEITVIHKFALGDEIAYLGKGEVNGHLLNQFSLDEYDGNLRVATTISQQWMGGGFPVFGTARGGVAIAEDAVPPAPADADGAPGATPESTPYATASPQATATPEASATPSALPTAEATPQASAMPSATPLVTPEPTPKQEGEPTRPEVVPVAPTPVPSRNNVYVLDAGLKVIGKLEDLAPGESIFSSRFMGKRAYLVTFKQLDPLFVIGLDDPANPKVLGKLKIPGYSDYLHPYDETHLIGLGKDAIPLKDSDSAFPLGLKLSLFDVSDYANPKEIANYKIGDAGTQSYALQDHHAFLFSRERGLLAIPVLLAEIDRGKYPAGSDEVHVYGEYKFQGAYVFNVGLEKGFELRGRVSHADNETFAKSGDYYGDWGTNVQRMAYISDVLYTASEKFVKANDLTTLEEKASVALPYSDYLYYPYATQTAAAETAAREG